TFEERCERACPKVVAVQRPAESGREYQPVVLPKRAYREALLVLAYAVALEGVDGECGELHRPPAVLRLWWREHRLPGRVALVRRADLKAPAIYVDGVPSEGLQLSESQARGDRQRVERLEVVASGRREERP